MKFRLNCGNVADNYYLSHVQESGTFTEWADGREMAVPKGLLRTFSKLVIHELLNGQTRKDNGKTVRESLSKVNYNRVIETWWDEYKEYYYQRHPKYRSGHF